MEGKSCLEFNLPRSRRHAEHETNFLYGLARELSVDYRFHALIFGEWAVTPTIETRAEQIRKCINHFTDHITAHAIANALW